jgi:hypothetical protein
MSTLKFSDGMSININGKLRIIHLPDGWYVVGEGCLIPVKDTKEGEEIIKKLSGLAKK